jgi:calcineurin-like phosphoesterase family protein
MNLKSKNQKIWFVSDTHFCHNKDFLWGGRGFNNVEDHDKFIISKWNEYISKDDIVFHLGDFMLNGSIEKLKSYLEQLTGNINLIWGNHNGYIYPYYKNLIKFYFPHLKGEIYPFQYDDAGAGNTINFLGSYHEIFIDNTPVVLSHFPYSIFNYCNKGGFNICGHSHGSFIESTPNYIKGGKVLDCGIENALKYTNNERPFLSWEEVKSICNKKIQLVKDHHN